ncbi:hypothetical protein Tco_0436192 [Tanacetum coccineum]
MTLITLRDLFLYDKLTEDDQEKSKVIEESIPPYLIQVIRQKCQLFPVIAPFTDVLIHNSKARRHFPLRSLLHQSTTEAINNHHTSLLKSLHSSPLAARSGKMEQAILKSRRMITLNRCIGLQSNPKFPAQESIKKQELKRVPQEIIRIKKGPRERRTKNQLTPSGTTDTVALKELVTPRVHHFSQTQAIIPRRKPYLLPCPPPTNTLHQAIMVSNPPTAQPQAPYQVRSLYHALPAPAIRLAAASSQPQLLPPLLTWAGPPRTVRHRAEDPTLPLLGQLKPPCERLQPNLKESTGITGTQEMIKRSSNSSRSSRETQRLLHPPTLARTRGCAPQIPALKESPRPNEQDDNLDTRGSRCREQPGFHDEGQLEISISGKQMWSGEHVLTEKIMLWMIYEEALKPDPEEI